MTNLVPRHPDAAAVTLVLDGDRQCPCNPRTDLCGCQGAPIRKCSCYQYSLESDMHNSYPYRLDAARESSAAVVAEIRAELAEPITHYEACPECGGDFPVNERGTYTTHLIAWDGKPCRNEEMTR